MSRSRNKGNRAERHVATALHSVDGIDPNFQHIQTSAGRVGPYYNLMLDVVSPRFAAEVKNRESIGDWVFDAVKQVQARADKHGKTGLHIVTKNNRGYVVMLDLEDFVELLDAGE